MIVESILGAGRPGRRHESKVVGSGYFDDGALASGRERKKCWSQANQREHVEVTSGETRNKTRGSKISCEAIIEKKLEAGARR